MKHATFLSNRRVTGDQSAGLLALDEWLAIAEQIGRPYTLAAPVPEEAPTPIP